jgi:signal transduction histidine kinase
VQDMRNLGLGLNDFARHDAAGEMLMLARTTQMSAHDSMRLADRLSQRTHQLESILELSSNGVAAFDGKGVLRHVNTPLTELLGLSRQSLLGASLDNFETHVQTLVAPGHALEPLRLLGSRAGQCVIHLSAPRPAVVELRARTGTEGGLIIYWRDMTAESEVDRMKSEFLSTAAHELRTPMVSIFGFAELMLTRAMPEERRQDALSTIHRQSGLLIMMVNELLDLARIEARQGKDLTREPVLLDSLVHESVTAMGGVSGQRPIDVRLDHGHCLLLVDAAKTQQALGNVLSNAFKYSAPGSGVQIRSSAAMVEGRPLIGLTISDNGIGMNAEQLERVFERFYRADPSGNIPGTGLGMSLVREIVELQGGRVTLSSTTGKGTQVTLWLPPTQANGLVPAVDDAAPTAQADASAITPRPPPDPGEAPVALPPASPAAPRRSAGVPAAA